MKNDHMLVKPAILFISNLNENSEILNSVIKENFQVYFHKFKSSEPEDFLEYLHETFTENAPLAAIYAGFTAFGPIGGLTKDMIEHAYFPRHSLQCITLCSRGVDFVDIKALSAHGIKLLNYEDDMSNIGSAQGIIKPALAGNDVADCVLWHVIEGFRKFSLQQSNLRYYRTTNLARFCANGRSPEAVESVFGHELRTCLAKSPRGQKVLILGLGAIGKKIAYKLQHGLGMEVHYAKRNSDIDAPWSFHALDGSLLPKLSQFSTIVVALPGTPETKHLIDRQFLTFCSDELILVNVGRGTILEQTAINDAVRENKLRHLGMDVYYSEPYVDEYLLDCVSNVSSTPHVGSGTADVFNQSCDFALNNIIEVVLKGKSGHSLVV
ncbi:LANO_0C00342g1_1 [Lachancea nothofagi CBS 11611]|uniref:LANO_0C00342g1_1 n=1 Tax=Lachancea nothofagi CBS 11611 TaxID=1266666 RepID=A0A1G4J3P8_9SACH|nr:LANO_0C00342g1_1 [Lachancea nothofagi CBS 11611]